LQDLLFSKEGKVQASDKWPPKAAILRHGTRLKAELVKLQIKRGLSSKEELERSGGDVASESQLYRSLNAEFNAESLSAQFAAQIPRYVRCNTNILSTSRFISNMTSANPPWTLLSTPTYPVPARSFFQDPHLSPDLFALPAATKFDKNLDYANGGIILQDKASCFPAKVLMHDWKDGEGQVIDGT
jgi:putative methyltransferase